MFTALCLSEVRFVNDVKRLAARLAFWEAQSVPPYAQDAIDPSCGEGTPQGTPPAWGPWC